MNGSGSSFYRYGEPSVGEEIAIDQIKKGDKINAVAAYKNNPTRLIQFYAKWDGDNQELAGDDYNFILVERPKPKPEDKFPTAIGAIIEFDGYVPAVLTHKGWVFISFIGTVQKDNFLTPAMLANWVGDIRAENFTVIHKGDSSF